MKFGEIFYWVAVVGFAWMTFAIVRGNFRRKFDEQGRRRDLVDPDEQIDSEQPSNRATEQPKEGD